jgi:hypothetical protein
MITSARTARLVAAAAATFAAAALTVAAAISAWPTPAAATTAATRIPRCAAANLGVWVAADYGKAAGGTAFEQLEFTNVSHRGCILDGFPKVSAIAVNGHQLGSPASQDHSVTARSVQLAAGATAHAVLEYGDVVVGNCPSASQRVAFELKVYTPGASRPDHAFWDLVTCTARGSSDFLGVQVIVSGSGVAG